MNKNHIAAILAAMTVSLPILANTDSTSSTQMCGDGTTTNASGKGACSGHGGVQKASPGTTGAMATPAADAALPPAKLTPSASTSASPPAGATAKCKDGTYSKSKNHSGACSRHGGVANWLTAGN